MSLSAVELRRLTGQRKLSPLGVNDLQDTAGPLATYCNLGGYSGGSAAALAVDMLPSEASLA